MWSFALVHTTETNCLGGGLSYRVFTKVLLEKFVKQRHIINGLGIWLPKLFKLADADATNIGLFVKIIS